MKLQTICNVKTLLTESEDGPIAAFILPSSSLVNATCSCRVHIRTGQLRHAYSTSYITPSTVLEMDWAAYRYGAVDNLELKRKSAVQNQLADLLKAWLLAVPADNIKLFFGGDINSDSDLDAIKEAATQAPDKNIYMQTIWKPRRQPQIEGMPSNLQIGLLSDHIAWLYTPASKVVEYSAFNGIDELYAMPSKEFKRIVWRLDNRCLEAFETKKPLLDTLLS